MVSTLRWQCHGSIPRRSISFEHRMILTSANLCSQKKRQLVKQRSAWACLINSSSIAHLNTAVKKWRKSLISWKLKRAILTHLRERRKAKTACSKRSKSRWYRVSMSSRRTFTWKIRRKVSKTALKMMRKLKRCHPRKNSRQKRKTEFWVTRHPFKATMRITNISRTLNSHLKSFDLTVEQTLRNSMKSLQKR